MPQDSLRSVVYRSFVSCDDPKGVVECKTIRKSKMMECKIRNETNTSLSYKEERKEKVVKESTEELQKNLSSFRIMEVSRGAEKLHEVTDSWSNRPSFDKHVAKDLLRGALDLHESLEKLQEASKYIAKPMKKHKEKERVAVGTDFIDSIRIRDDDQAMEDVREPRVSSDRSSRRDCYDELREVIRESFARQNLLYGQKNDYPCRKNSAELCMDVASSSSSQSSLINSHSSAWSLSSLQHEKPKGHNLIAKLMGLEEVQSRPVDFITFKQMENEKLSNQRRGLLDIDLPRPKKPHESTVARERRTLEEMIETMQFKGLVDRSNDAKCHSDDSFMRKGSAFEGPPIVIMRPLRVVPNLHAEEILENQGINEEKPIKSRQMARSMRRASEVPRGQLKKFVETNEKLAAGRPPKQSLNKDKEGKYSGQFSARPVKKALDSRLSTTKINHCKPLVPRMQKKEAVAQKIKDVPKIVSNTMKQEQAKSRRSNRTQDLSKLMALKLNKTVRESNVSKSQVAAANKNMKQTSVKSSIAKKNSIKDKTNSKPSADLVEDIEREDILPMNIGNNIEESLKCTASEQIAEEVTNASYTSITDNSVNVASSPCETISTDDLSGVEDRSCIPSHHLDEMEGFESVLLSSVSFLNHVEEFFDTGTTCNHAALQTTCLADSEVLDDSLLLECAKEIVERKSLFCTRTIDPLSKNVLRKPKCRLSIEQLVREISDGIEDLRNYSKPCGDIVLVDNISPMLERDLWWKEEVLGGWDLGWRNGYTSEAINEVMHDLEKLVLSEVIADMLQ